MQAIKNTAQRTEEKQHMFCNKREDFTKITFVFYYILHLIRILRVQHVQYYIFVNSV